MTYNCDIEDQELIENKNLESCSSNVNVINQLVNYDSIKSADKEKKVPDTKRKPFKIPDHISMKECNYGFYFYFLVSV